MHKTVLLALALLISAVCSPAQQGHSSSSADQKNVPGLTTIEGCLQSASGQYSLTDSSGKVYQLSGYANKLSRHIGHQVQITGKPGVKTVSDTSYGAASSAEQIPVFDVKTVTHVADTCKAK